MPTRFGCHVVTAWADEKPVCPPYVDATFRVNDYVSLSPRNGCGLKLFFTVVACRRQPILCDEAIRNALRAAIASVRSAHLFVIDAWVLLPDHLHCVWTLPEGDADFLTRWRLIKRAVSLACRGSYRRTDWVTASKLKHRESTIWQRRFWEHQIRDDLDLQRHVDYIHYNPVKHGHVARVADWPYSTFHRYVQRGIYPPDWAGGADDSGDWVNRLRRVHFMHHGAHSAPCRGAQGTWM